MNSRELQEKADSTIAKTLNKHLGYKLDFTPISFSSINHNILCSWKWELKPEIDSKTIAGNFNDLQFSYYYDTNYAAQEDVKRYLAEVAEGKHNTYDTMKNIVESDPLMSFSKHTIDLGTLDINFNYQEHCNSCGGSGQNCCNGCRGNGRVTCPTCFGSTQMTCRHCNGSGRSHTSNRHQNCISCGGRGKVFCYHCHFGKINCNSCGGSGKITCGSCSGYGIFSTRYVVDVKATRSWSIYFAKEISDWGRSFIQQCIDSNNGPNRILQNALFIKVETDKKNKKPVNLAYIMHGQLPLSEYKIVLNTSDQPQHSLKFTGSTSNSYDLDSIVDEPALQICHDFYSDMSDLEKAKAALELPIHNTILEFKDEMDQDDIQKACHNAVSAEYILHFYHNGFLKLIEHLKSLRKTRFKQLFVKFSATIFSIFLICGIALNTLYPGINWSESGTGMLINNFSEAISPINALYDGLRTGYFYEVGIIYTISVVSFAIIGPLKIFTIRNFWWGFLAMPFISILIYINLPIIEYVANNELHIPSSFSDTSLLLDILAESLKQSIGMLFLSVLLGLSLARKAANWTMNNETKSLKNKYIMAEMNRK